jgi:hypothetical protein
MERIGNMKKYAALTLIVFATTWMVSGFVFAQGQATSQSAKNQNDDGDSIVVQGKIAYLKQLGGYILNGETPAGEFIIVNQDPQVLEKLLKNANKVKIEGRLRGAEFLTIEKIDGKPYRGESASK